MFLDQIINSNAIAEYYSQLQPNQETVAGLQKVAWDHLGKMPKVSRKSENYRYFSNRRWKDIQLNLLPTSECLKPGVEVTEAIASADQTVHIYVEDGVISVPQYLKELGIDVVPMADLPQIFSEYSFNRAFLESEDPLFVCSQAQLGLGLGLVFTQSLSQPVHIHHKLSSRFRENTIFIQQAIAVKSGCSVSIIESVDSHASLCHLSSRVFLEKNACLEQLGAWEASEKETLFTDTRATVSEGAVWNHFVYSRGGEKLDSTLTGGALRHVVKSRLVGAQSHCQLVGLYECGGDVYCDHQTQIDHEHEHTTSKQLYKGILNDGGIGVFNGAVTVFRDAQKVRAKQLNKNLLLSPDAKAYTKPQLLIDADDVKCAHGATIGQVRDDELFYLQSRGIPKDRARQILADGFGMDTIDCIQSETLKNYLLAFRNQSKKQTSKVGK